MSAKLKAQGLQGSYDLQLIPLVIRYAAGAPAVLSNPTGEEVTLTDNGTGDVTVTLGSAGIAPLILAGCAVRPTDPATLGLIANLSGAPTASALRLVVNSGADGATETDPVDIHLCILKQVAA